MNLMMRLLPQVLFAVSMMVISFWVILPAYADIGLYVGCPEYNYNNGRPYWLIDDPGDYYLAIPEDTFYTTNYFAIRIRCDNVTLDGKGKTITGSGPPPDEDGDDDICGVMVNRGPQAKNVRIKNVKVEKKYHGILFGWIYNGTVENCTTTGNNQGITLWNSEWTTLKGNTANYNKNGIVLDAHLLEEGNKNNTIINNTANNNTCAGIILHLENAYNIISGNTANKNGDFGIQLPGNSHDNTLSGNTTSENPAGILIRSSFSNTIKGNTITQNRDKGIWLYAATNNTIYDNYFSNPVKNVGFDGACTGNKWNTSKTDGTNIVGGLYLGGNFWATPDGDGFSQTTPDSDGDGFCDSAYSIRPGDVDYLPLREVKAVSPTVTTTAPSGITSCSATTGGNITLSAGALVTARGVCWSTSENPTINDRHTTDGTGTGAFESNITRLNPVAAYHVRAYGTNSAGTGYGVDLPFITQPFEGIVYVSSNDQSCGDHCPCYTTIQAAIDAPYDVYTIKIAEGTNTEPFTLNESKAIIVEGGWNASFTSQTPNTTKIKSPTVRIGCMSFRNLIIVP